MPRKPRIHYTETDKAQFFDRTHGSVARILRQTGGHRLAAF
jgi:hypothetical protein